jgi:hypothetical protein
LHLLPAGELPLYAAARSVQAGRNWLKYFTYFGITPAQYDAILAAVPQVLGSQPVTREQLATALARHISAPELGRLLLSSSWGSLWKPSALRGDLCFGPSQGRNVTFVNPRKWIGKWQPVEPYPALQEIARRYLCAFGPSTPELFARWWELGIVPARKLFQSITDELETVDVEGWRAFALRATLEPMQSLELSGAANLLPLFDAYTLGLARGAELEPLLPQAYQRQVYRPQGWISAVVLVDGFMKGVWEYKNRRSQTILKVHMFSSPAASIRKGIQAEAERLGAFWDTQVALEYDDC